MGFLPGEIGCRIGCRIESHIGLEASDEDGGAGGADGLIQQEGAPAAVESHIQLVEEDGGDQRPQKCDGDKRVSGDLRRFPGTSQNAGEEEGVGFGETDDGDENHDDGSHFDGGGVGGVEAENFFAKKDGGGTGQARE